MQSGITHPTPTPTPARHYVNAKRYYVPNPNPSPNPNPKPHQHRYLCAKDPSYHNKLTEASKITLGHQGGPMTPEECAEVCALG